MTKVLPDFFEMEPAAIAEWANSNGFPVDSALDKEPMIDAVLASIEKKEPELLAPASDPVAAPELPKQPKKKQAKVAQEPPVDLGLQAAAWFSTVPFFKSVKAEHRNGNMHVALQTIHGDNTAVVECKGKTEAAYFSAFKRAYELMCS